MCKRSVADVFRHCRFDVEFFFTQNVLVQIDESAKVQFLGGTKRFGVSLPQTN